MPQMSNILACEHSMIKISEISVSDMGIGIGIIGYRKILKYRISVSGQKCDIGPSLPNTQHFLDGQQVIFS